MKALQMTVHQVTSSRLLAVFLLLAAAGYARTDDARAQAEIDTTAEQQYAPSVLRADVDYVVQKVRSVHPQPEAFISADSLRRHAEQIKRSIDQPMTRPEFLVRVAPLLAGLDDGHSSVPGPQPSMQEWMQDANLFPLSVMLKEGRAYAVGSAVEDGEKTVGHEILSISGVPVSEIVAKIVSLYPGQRRAARAASLERYLFHYYLWIVYDFEPPFEVTYQQEGSNAHVSLAGVSGEQLLPFLRQRISPKQAYRSTSDSVGVLTVRSFSANPDSFEVFLDRTFEQVRSGGVRDLVIDVRGNHGGRPANAQRLLAYLEGGQPDIFRIFEIRASADLKETQRRRMANRPSQTPSEQYRRLQQAEDGELIETTDPDATDPVPSSERYEGRVWVLTDRRVGSAAHLFAGLVKEHELGTLVGRPTEAAAGITFATAFPLEMPGSGLRFLLAASRSIFGAEGDFESPDPSGVRPDLHIERSVSDVAGGVDTDMAHVLELIRERSDAAIGKER